MAKALMLVWTNPVSEEAEDEFNSWYDDTHIADVKAVVPSIRAVTRYRTAAPSLGDGAGQTVHRYLAVYELDSDDVLAAAGQLEAGMAAGKVALSPALDLETAPPTTQLYTLA